MSFSLCLWSRWRCKKLWTFVSKFRKILFIKMQWIWILQGCRTFCLKNVVKSWRNDHYIQLLLNFLISSHFRKLFSFLHCRGVPRTTSSIHNLFCGAIGTTNNLDLISTPLIGSTKVKPNVQFEKCCSTFFFEAI